MKTIAYVPFLLVVAIGAAGCSTNLCERKSPCANDVQRTQAQIDQCKASLDANSKSDCYSEALAFANCQIDNIVCGGDGKTDAKLSETQIENTCRDQKANIVSCCVKSPNATVCR